jgi:hypothetical protein
MINLLMFDVYIAVPTSDSCEHEFEVRYSTTDIITTECNARFIHMVWVTKKRRAWTAAWNARSFLQMKSANPRQIYQFVPSNMIHHKKLKT